jgi:hypothetical protein
LVSSGTGGENYDLRFRDHVDEAVLIVDPSRPRPRQVVLQRFGLADAGKGSPPDVLNQLVDPREHLAIGLEPGRAVLPVLIFDNQPHCR